MTGAWPAGQAAEAMSELARAAGLGGATEAEEVFSTYGEFERDLRSLGPAIVPLGDSEVLAIVGRRGSGIQLVTPGGSIHAVPISVIRDAVCQPLETPHQGAIDVLLDRAQTRGKRREHARSVLLRQRLGSYRIRGIWLVRLAPGAPFDMQLRQARVPRRILALAGLHAIQYLLWIVSWWILGAAALSGAVVRGWFVAWCLLLATLIPFRVCITWLQGTSAIIAGAVLKQRLFYGALHLHPDAIRHQGVGQLLGRVIESEAVESLALGGGLQALLALVELILVGGVLGLGGDAALLLPGLIFITGALAALGGMWLLKYRPWTEWRLAMTHDLVENMIGHRTRLAQQPAEQWHAEEDEGLAEYAGRSRALDRVMLWMTGVPRVWLISALAAMALQLPLAPSARAITLGGILLAFRALRRLTSALPQILAALVAWERVAPLFRSRPEAHLQPSPGGLVVDARDLAFRYAGRAEPVLSDCNLQIGDHERILLEGASGGGKSTLVSLLTGLRKVESGSLRVRAIAAAPQFHDNHVLAETFAFNALMARNRIPEPAAIAEAEALCRELGLGTLLERMPAGMLQLVGESGWQLSHGERSRLYIARALLQPADLLVLDESFAALDPENLKLVVECVLRHARGVLVIAHR